MKRYLARIETFYGCAQASAETREREMARASKSTGSFDGERGILLLPGGAAGLAVGDGESDLPRRALSTLTAAA